MIRRSAAAAVACIIAAVGLTPSAGAVAPRIIGGSPISIAEAPWQALITMRSQQQCGGVVVTGRWILTAAHCVDTSAPQDISVRVGVTTSPATPDQPTRQVDRIEIFPGWEPRSFRNDIALLHLTEELRVSPTTAPLALPTAENGAVWPQVGTPATITGWGATNSGGVIAEQLQRANVRILADPNDPICGAYGDLFDPASQICAGEVTGGVDACQGDSGGALVVGTPATLSGLASTGVGCADSGYPGLYTRVTTYLPWILSQIGTPGMRPGAPTSVTAQSPRTGRVRVAWQPPQFDGGQPIVSYEVRIGDKACTTQGMTCVIKGLKPGSRPRVVVVATNVLGAGEPVRARVRVR